jgi:hypothetical protein
LYKSKDFASENTCTIYFYDGENLENIEKNVITDSLIGILNQYPTATKNAKKQYTNLKTIIDTVIPRLTNKYPKYNLTIISDLFHDDSLHYKEILHCDFKKLRNTIGNNSINLIITDHNKSKTIKYHIQNEFINNFRNHFDGTAEDTVNHISYIDLEHYTNNYFCDCDSALLEFEEIYRNNSSVPKIIFSSPISNGNDIDIAKAKLGFYYLNDNNDTIKIKKYAWKISETFRDNSTLIGYKDDLKDNLHNYFYHTNFVNKNTIEPLELQIKLKPEHLSNYDDLKFCISYQRENFDKTRNITTISNHFHEFDIVVKKTNFPDAYKNFLRKMLNSFCFLLLIALISDGILFISDFVSYRRSPGQNVWRDSFWALGIVLLIIIFAYLLYFIWLC